VGYGASGVTVDLGNPRAPQAVMAPGAAAYVSSLDTPGQYYVQKGWNFDSEKKKTLRGNLHWDSEGGLFRSFEIGGLYEDSRREGRALAPDNTR